MYPDYQLNFRTMVVLMVYLTAAQMWKHGFRHFCNAFSFPSSRSIGTIQQLDVEDGNQKAAMFLVRLGNSTEKSGPHGGLGAACLQQQHLLWTNRTYTTLSAVVSMMILCSQTTEDHCTWESSQSFCMWPVREIKGVQQRKFSFTFRLVHTCTQQNTHVIWTMCQRTCAFVILWVMSHKSLS